MHSKKFLWIGILTSLIFVFFFLHKLIFNINTPFAKEGDWSFSYFIQDNNLKKLKSFDFQNLFDTRMFYPHKNTLAFGNSYLVQSMMALPIFMITGNVIISTHFIILINFFLTFLVAYFYAYEICKNIGGSILAGLIFTYNPFVMAQFEHLEAITLAWIPLVLLSTEKLLKKVSLRWSLVLSFFLLACLISAFYYFFILVIIWPIYLFLRIYFSKLDWRKLLSWKLLIPLILVSFIGFLYLRPYIEVRNQYTVLRNLEINTLLSAQMTDFLFTSKNNYMYGWMVNNPGWRLLRTQYTNIHSTEHSLFPGIIVYFLGILTVFLIIKKRFGKDEKREISFFAILFLIVVILSFGPYISFSQLKIPSLYLLIYKIIPFADSLRVPSRFMIIGFLMLAVILGFAWQRISKNIPFAKSFFLLIILLISLEYSHNIGQPFHENLEVKKFYSWLNEQKEVKVILEVPMFNFIPGSRPSQVSLYHDTEYLFYALYHQKKLVNGFNSFIPDDVLEFGDFLTFNFPSEDHIAVFKKTGIDTIIIHRNEFEDRGILQSIIDKFEVLGVKQIYNDQNIITLYIGAL